MRSSIAFSLLVAIFALPLFSQAGPTARNGYEIHEIGAIPTDLPTALTLDDQGRVYCITTTGLIYRFPAPNGTTTLTPTLWYDGSSTLNIYCTGITWHNGKAYVSHRGTISTIEDSTGDDLGDLKADLITGLPSGTQAQFTSDHQNNQVVFDNDGYMYFGIGSQTDSGIETQPFSATVMRANDDGSGLQVHATGIRNAFDLAYHPSLGLMATENAPNLIPGNPDPVDEINLIVAGADYGFPDYFGAPPAGTGTSGPILELPAHAAPAGIAFDVDRQWSGFPEDAYVCLFAPGAGALVRCTTDKRSSGPEHDGFFEAIAFGFTAVIDCTFTDNGELLCIDFIGKKLYRIVPSDTSRIRLRDCPRVNSLTPISLEDPAEAGDAFLAGLSDLEAPGFVLSNGDVFHMNVNTFTFQFSTTPNNGVLGFAQSFLGPIGDVSGFLFVPDLPSLEGMQFYLGFLSAELPSFTLGSVSETLPFRILPAD